MAKDDYPTSDARERSYKEGGSVKNYWSPEAIQARVKAYQDVTKKSYLNIKKRLQSLKKIQKEELHFKLHLEKQEVRVKKNLLLKVKDIIQNLERVNNENILV